MTKVTIITSDDQRIFIEKSLIEKSQLIRSMIDDAGTDEPIPLPSISKIVMDDIV